LLEGALIVNCSERSEAEPALRDERNGGICREIPASINEQ
jgi:hypothetical protein